MTRHIEFCAVLLCVAIASGCSTQANHASPDHKGTVGFASERTVVKEIRFKLVSADSADAAIVVRAVGRGPNIDDHRPVGAMQPASYFDWEFEWEVEPGGITLHDVRTNTNASEPARRVVTGYWWTIVPDADPIPIRFFAAIRRRPRENGEGEPVILDVAARVGGIISRAGGWEATITQTPRPSVSLDSLKDERVVIDVDMDDVLRSIPDVYRRSVSGPSR